MIFTRPVMGRVKLSPKGMALLLHNMHKDANLLPPEGEQFPPALFCGNRKENLGSGRG